MTESTFIHQRFPAMRTRPQPTHSREPLLPFLGLWLFTLLLYVRPNESFPEVFGKFPLVKIVAISTLVAYVVSKLAQGGRLSVWPAQMQLVVLIWVLGAFSSLGAQNPQESLDILFDPFFKVVCIFLLLANLVNTRERLWALWKLVVVCGSFIAWSAISSYRSGEFINKDHERIRGVVSGIFGNPNDMATALNLLLPLGLALAFKSRGFARAVFLVCSAVLASGVIVSFSRAGFLGLLALSGVLAWKAGRQRMAATLLGVVLVIGVFLLAAPGNYAGRVSSIFATDSDPTGSAQERRELLKRAASIAVHHPALGVGMGNFHIYSIQEKVAHNAYLEIAAELGIVGLIAYLLLIYLTMRTLRRVERASQNALDEGEGQNAFAAVARSLATAKRSAPGEPETAAQTRLALRECYLFSVVLQAAVVAYAVCSFFASIQYQWYLYYLVAYAVALERIYADVAVAELAAEKPTPQPVPYRVHTRFNPQPQPIRLQRTSVYGD